MTQPPNACRLCWAKISLHGLHDEEIAAIEEAGDDYVCAECLDEDEIDGFDERAEFGTYRAINGSVVG